MNYQYVKIDSNNIHNYSAIWLDVIQMINKGASFDRALQIMKQNKANALEIEHMYKTSNVRLDFYHFMRTLDLDGQPIAFINGIIRYFDTGFFYQIGNFGVSRRFQKRGYGELFWKHIEEELQAKGVNYTWGIMKNQGFWEKQGFDPDSNHFIKNVYRNGNSENILYKNILTKQNTLEEFMHMFDEEFKINKNTKLNFIQNPGIQLK